MDESGDEWDGGYADRLALGVRVREEDGTEGVVVGGSPEAGIVLAEGRCRTSRWERLREVVL